MCNTDCVWPWQWPLIWFWLLSAGCASLDPVVCCGSQMLDDRSLCCCFLVRRHGGRRHLTHHAADLKNKNVPNQTFFNNSTEQGVSSQRMTSCSTSMGTKTFTKKEPTSKTNEVNSAFTSSMECRIRKKTARNW